MEGRVGDIQNKMRLPDSVQHESYWRYVKRQFRKNKRALISLNILYGLLFLFIFADFIANNKPLIAKHEGKLMVPVVKDYLVALGLDKWDQQYFNAEWQNLDYDFVIFAPIPYSPKQQDVKNTNVAPSGQQELRSWRWRHWLGTDGLGRDLLSAMIHATRIDLSIGVVAMGVATIIGLLLGAFAGFFGDDKIRISLVRLILNIPFLYLAWFYAFDVRSESISVAAQSGISSLLIQVMLSILIFMVIMVLPNLLANLLKKINFFNYKTRIPIDIIVSRIIEVVLSIPVIFLIIMILAVVQGGSIFWVMVIIGLTRWTGIARFVRAELLRIRSLEYIEAAKALGYSNKRILLRHALPNSLAPVFIAIAFGIASAILVEAFLSFIGVGVPADVLTWGSLLSEGREMPRNWWLALFPGLAIFITVTIFNLIGEGLTDALDPRLKE